MTRRSIPCIAISSACVLLVLWAAIHLFGGEAVRRRPQTALGALGSGVRSSGLSTDRTANEGPARRNIRIAVSAAFVSESGMQVYERIVGYLTRKIGRDCECVTGFSYSTISAMLSAGAVDIAFVCGQPYVEQKASGRPLHLVVAPVMKASRCTDQPKYFSYVIVHKDSSFQSFADLKGATYVYNDERSNSGYNMPRARLIELGEIRGFFGKVLRSGSHEESIRMVATGKVDASSVDSLVLDYDLENHPDYARQVKIIEVLGPAGAPPVVASPKTSQALRDQIQGALVGMKDDPQGRSILDEALIDRFQVVVDDNYDDIRRMRKMAKKAGFMEIR